MTGPEDSEGQQAQRQLRVLVVDDSAYNRRTIAEMLSAMPDVVVAGKASDGDEALRLVEELRPDLITLDLEMPRMDGFKFLRLLMARRPTPVIVVSGYSDRENVFRALELGALDFIAKPTRAVTTALETIRDELAEKVDMVRELVPTDWKARRTGQLGTGDRTATQLFRPVRAAREGGEAEPAETVAPRSVLVLGASTGGPTALVELFARLPSSTAVVIAQHMPERFTHTFAQRLDRISQLKVREASGVGTLGAGTGWVCPGGKCIELQRRAGELSVVVMDPTEEDRYVPSVDRLFRSAARAVGTRCTAVVLTGMGNDGAGGLDAIKSAGGRVLVESPETAVIHGMPGAAMRTGSVDESLPLPQLTEKIVEVLK